MYQVVATHGGSPDETRNVRTYTVCDANTGRQDGLGFTQPVTADRLSYVEVNPISRPVDDGPTRILLNDQEGTVEAQSLDGRVLIRFAEENEPEWYDLSQTTYRWLN